MQKASPLNAASKIFSSWPKHKVLLDPTSYRMAHPVYKLQDIEQIE